MIGTSDQLCWLAEACRILHPVVLVPCDKLVCEVWALGSRHSSSGKYTAKCICLTCSYAIIPTRTPFSVMVVITANVCLQPQRSSYVLLHSGCETSAAAYCCRLTARALRKEGGWGEGVNTKNLSASAAAALHRHVCYNPASVQHMRRAGGGAEGGGGTRGCWAGGGGMCAPRVTGSKTRKLTSSKGSSSFS